MEKTSEWKKAKSLVSFFGLLAVFFMLNAAYVIAAPPKFLTLPLQEEAVVGNGWQYGKQSDLDRSDKHFAIDYYVDSGTPIIASADGYAMYDCQPSCTNPGTDYGYGRLIIIKHDETDGNDKCFFTFYAHLSESISDIPKKSRFNAKNELDAKKNGWFRVRRGQLIGKSGKSGKQSWPHLHFAVFSNSYSSMCHPEKNSCDTKNTYDPYGLYKGTTVEDAANYYPPEMNKTINGKTRSSGSKYVSCGENRLWLTDPPSPPLYADFKEGSGVLIKGQGFGDSSGKITVDYRLPPMSVAPMEMEISDATLWTDNFIIVDIFRDSLNYSKFYEPILVKIYRKDGVKVGQLYFPFKDVEPDKWYAEAVTSLWKRGIIHGKSPGFYMPSENSNFAEFLTILVGTDPNLNAAQCQEGDIPFPINTSTADFPPYSEEENGGPWYCKYYKEDSIQKWVEELRYLDSSRGWPGQEIKRKEVAFFLAKATETNLYDGISGFSDLYGYGGISGFSDVDNDDNFAPYIKKCKKRGIFCGYEDGTFKPEKEINRAEIAKVIKEAFFK